MQNIYENSKKRSVQQLYSPRSSQSSVSRDLVRKCSSVIQRVRGRKEVSSRKKIVISRVLQQRDTHQYTALAERDAIILSLLLGDSICVPVLLDRCSRAVGANFSCSFYRSNSFSRAHSAIRAPTIYRHLHDYTDRVASL